MTGMAVNELLLMFSRSAVAIKPGPPVAQLGSPHESSDTCVIIWPIFATDGNNSDKSLAIWPFIGRDNIVLPRRFPGLLGSHSLTRTHAAVVAGLTIEIPALRFGA